jgi:hypothetical protein
VSTRTPTTKPGELEVRVGWLLSAIAVTLFPIIIASVIFGAMGATFGWLASTKQHPDGRRVTVVGIAATVVGTTLGVLWRVFVKG